jgi:predicted nuclease of predicted toxin-antitoxin system
VKILLDENFPLQLHRRLRARAIECEHMILLGRRGASDAEIRQRVGAEGLVLLTQDKDFLGAPPDGGIVIVSSVSQSISVRERVEIWFRALTRFLETKPSGRLFELGEAGSLVPWQRGE